MKLAQFKQKKSRKKILSRSFLKVFLQKGQDVEMTSNTQFSFWLASNQGGTMLYTVLFSFEMKHKENDKYIAFQKVRFPKSQIFVFFSWHWQFVQVWLNLAKQILSQWF